MIVDPNDPLSVIVEKQAKIIDALIKRSARQALVDVSAFQAFQAALDLKERVETQARDLSQAADDLNRALYEQRRIRWALAGALSSMDECFALFSDGLLDLFNDRFGSVFPECATAMKSGLGLNAFIALIWSSVEFVSCEFSAEEVIAFAAGGSPNEVGLSTVFELRHDMWYQLNIQRTSPENVVLLLTDITALVRRNRAEKDNLIAEQAGYLQAVFQDISSGICTFSADDKVMINNAQFKDLFGLPDALLASGTPLHDIVAYLERHDRLQSDQVLKIKQWRASLRKERTFQRRVKLVQDQFLDLRATALPDEGFILEVKDVTLEARHKDMLENRVAERTADLTRANEELIRGYEEKARVEEELRLAKERAEAAVSSKTRFLAAASHDLLQPINAAKLLISTLRETTTQTAFASIVERLDGAFGSAEQLLHSLLDLSRLESPDPDTVSPTTVSLGPILEGIHADQSVVARKRGITLTMVPTSAFVRSDPVYLMRSMQNLVVNAIEYTPPGGRVLLGCRLTGDQITVEVWDTGVGIAPEDQQRIFEAFARLDSSRTGTGVGLGLSVVDRACRLLGHRLSVQSSPGKGSVFRIAIDRVAGASLAPDWHPNSPLEGLEPLDFNILVLEDDEKVLDGMTLWLEQRGAAVLPARSLPEAMHLATEFGICPDIILADYQLGGEQTGMDAIRQIRALYDISIPSVLITANRDKSLWQQSAQSDILVLCKPVKLAVLQSLIVKSVMNFRVSGQVAATDFLAPGPQTALAR